MSYFIELGEWGSVFAVPSSVVDKHIKLVGSSQLKVLLWIFRNSGKEFSTEDISAALSIHKEDVKDAINYWTETGILKCREGVSEYNKKTCNVCDENIENKEIKENFSAKNDISEKSAKDKTRPTSRMLRPDSSYVSERIKNSEEIAFLMQEAQVILGRPISMGDSAVLLMLMDNEGLPIDVILMIMQYAVGIGKGNMRYIEAVGISWAKEEIDTIEKAEKKIKSLSETNKAWREFSRIIGAERHPVAREEEAVNRWYNIWKYTSEMVKEAYEICVNSNGKYVLKYIDSIITRWNKEGIRTLTQVHAERNNSSKSKVSSDKRTPSYNMNEYEKYNIFDEIR